MPTCPPSVLVLALALTTGACSALRFGGESEYDLSGTWTGSVDADGQRIPGSLSIEQTDDDLNASFVSPEFELNAAGVGEVNDDGTFRLELDYDLQCPGNAVLEGTVSGDRALLTGSVEATDCTGTVTGSFSFDRSSGPSGEAAPARTAGADRAATLTRPTAHR